MFQFLQDHQQAFKITMIVVFSIALVILTLLSVKYEIRQKTNGERIKKLVTISILSAISIVLYLFLKFPMNIILPFIPGFLDVQFSNLPVYIGGFMFGPISGTMITIVRLLVKLPSTTTAGVGELADFIIGFSTVLVSSMIYHHHKTKKGALAALLSVVITWTVSAIIINWGFILAFYMHLYGFEAVYGMLTAVPGITEQNYMLNYIIFAVIPFNVILSSMVAFVTFVLYKRLSKIYTEIHFSPKRHS